MASPKQRLAVYSLLDQGFGWEDAAVKLNLPYADCHVFFLEYLGG